jgi:hypothetical protein
MKMTLTPTPIQVRALQSGHGGFGDHMRKYCGAAYPALSIRPRLTVAPWSCRRVVRRRVFWAGMVGTVKKIDGDSDVRVRFKDGRRMCYNRLALSASPDIGQASCRGRTDVTCTPSLAALVSHTIDVAANGSELCILKV